MYTLPHPTPPGSRALVPACSWRRTCVRTASYFVGPVLAVDLAVALVAGRDALVPGEALVLIRLARRVRVRRRCKYTKIGPTYKYASTIGLL